MARTDRAVFNANLRTVEDGLNVLFAQLASDVGQAVFRAQDEDGLVPVEKLPELQAQVERLVDALFLGPQRRPFDDQHRPLAPYPRVLAEGLQAQVDLAFDRTERTLDRVLSDEQREELQRAARGY